MFADLHHLHQFISLDQGGSVTGASWVGGTHATDADTNAERDHIVAELTGSGSIGEVRCYQPGEYVRTAHVNRYMTDGAVSVATLKESLIKSRSTRLVNGY